MCPAVSSQTRQTALIWICVGKKKPWKDVYHPQSSIIRIHITISEGTSRVDVHYNNRNANCQTSFDRIDPKLGALSQRRSLSGGPCAEQREEDCCIMQTKAAGARKAGQHRLFRKRRAEGKTQR